MIWFVHLLVAESISSTALQPCLKPFFTDELNKNKQIYYVYMLIIYINIYL